MVTFSALVIPEISNTILTYLLPSLLTLTFELNLPVVSYLTGQALSARLMDREHVVIYTTRRLQAKKTTFTGTVLQDVTSTHCTRRRTVLLYSTYFAD